MTTQAAPQPIVCECGFRIWDGEVVRSRVLRIREDDHFEAKCRCKRWLSIPVALRPKQRRKANESDNRNHQINHRSRGS